MPSYSGTGAPSQPTFLTSPNQASVNTLANQLSTGFWTAQGGVQSKFAVKPGDTLNVDL